MSPTPSGTCFSNSRPNRPQRPSLLAVLLVCSLTLSYGCGTPVIKTDTSPCNRPELTSRPNPLPQLQTKDVRAAVKNHLQVTEEFTKLRNRHDGLARCVEENSR